MYMPSLLLADLVSGNPLLAGPVLPSLGTTVYGPAMSFPGTSGGAGYIAGTGPFLGGLSAWSICTLVRSTASPNAGGSALYCERATSGNDILKVIVSSSSSGAAVYRNDAGTLINQNFGPVSVTDGRIYLVSATFDNSNVISYADSTVETSSGWGGANNNFTDANIQRTIGYDVADSTASFNGHILAVYLYKRALSPSEIAHLQNRPFSMLRPRARRIYSVPSINANVSGVAATGNRGTSTTTTSSPILFAGGEDLSFVGINAPITTGSGNPIVINTTSASGQFRSSYARCSINIVSGVYANISLNTFLIRTGTAFSASTFWTSGRFWGAAGSLPTSGFPFMRWVDSNGVVRLLIQTASSSGSSLGVYKVNAAGTQTQLGVNTASGVSASPATADKIDVFIDYVSERFILYINGTQIYNYSGDLTTDGNASLSYVDYGMALGSAFVNTANNHWSECIVSTSDTRQMSLVTQAPGASGNTTGFTSGAAPNVNGTSVGQTSPDYSSTANQLQQYQVGQAIPAGTFSVISLVQHAQCTVSSGPQHFQFNVRTGGNDYFTSNLAPSTGWTLLTNNWDTNPATSAAWATTDLPASSTSFNFGYKSTS